MGRELAALEEVPAGNVLGTCQFISLSSYFIFTDTINDYWMGMQPEVLGLRNVFNHFFIVG